MLTTFAVLIISAIYYWPLALLLAIVFPIYVWLTALTSRNWQTHQDVINHHIDTAGGRFQEVVSQIRVVKEASRVGGTKRWERRRVRVCRLLARRLPAQLSLADAHLSLLGKYRRRARPPSRREP